MNIKEHITIEMTRQEFEHYLEKAYSQGWKAATVCDELLYKKEPKEYAVKTSWGVIFENDGGINEN